MKTTDTGSEATKELAKFCSALRFEDIPSEVIDKAKTGILDTLGCCLFGSTLPSVKMLAETVAEEGATPESSAFGLRLKTSAANAALINGTSSHAFQLDEIHIESTLHPGSTAVPSAFALAEAGSRVSGRTLITAIIAANEVGTRIGLAAKGGMFARGYHNQGTTGALVSAVAAARTLGLDAAHTQHALGIAGSQAAGLMAVQEGAMAKGFHSGRAAQSGVYAAKLARRGYTGIPDVLEAPYGGFLSTLAGEVTTGPLTAELGRRWETLRIGYKPAPASNGSITAMMAMDRVMREHTLKAGDVARIEAAVSTNTLHHCGWPYEPEKLQGVLAAQMNLRYGIAVMALERRATVEEFTEEKMREPRILDFVRLVDVRVEPRFDASGGKHRVACHLTVYRKDGSRHETEVLFRKGSSEDPMTGRELRDKFIGLATKAITPDAAAKIAETVEMLDRLDPPDGLWPLLK